MNIIRIFYPFLTSSPVYVNMEICYNIRIRYHIYHGGFSMEQNIYFDNGSTSWPKAPGVAASMTKLLESGAFNINRGNYEGAYELEIRYLRPACSSPDFSCTGFQMCRIYTGDHLFSELSAQRIFKARRPRAGQQSGTQCRDASALSACFTGYPLYDDSCRDRRHNASGIARSSDPSGDKSSHHAPRFQCMRNHSANP